EEEHDLARSRLPRVDEVTHASRDVPRLSPPPMRAGVFVAVLVRHEQLDGWPERRIREAPRRGQRLERLAEVGREEVVDHIENLGPRAVVLRQGQHAADLPAPLAEDLDVRVSEAVDRLELVAHEEELAVVPREQIDELALEPVCVLELVDHDRAEAPALTLPDLLVLLQQIAREELEILEVERRLAVLRGPVRAVVAEQQLLQLLAVARSQRLERRGLDGVARLLVCLGLARALAQVGEVEQRLGPRRRLQVAQHLLLSDRLRGGAQLLEPSVELQVARRLELQ